MCVCVRECVRGGGAGGVNLFWLLDARLALTAENPAFFFFLFLLFSFFFFFPPFFSFSPLLLHVSTPNCCWMKNGTKIPPVAARRTARPALAPLRTAPAQLRTAPVPFLRRPGPLSAPTPVPTKPCLRGRSHGRKSGLGVPLGWFHAAAGSPCTLVESGGVKCCQYAIKRLQLHLHAY